MVVVTSANCVVCIVLESVCVCDCGGVRIFWCDDVVFLHKFGQRPVCAVIEGLELNNVCDVVSYRPAIYTDCVVIVTTLVDASHNQPLHNH